jgi:hypothetical protein
VTDVKRELPHAIIDGFDISLDQAPTQEMMPNDTSVRVWDATQPPPSELVGAYDIVNVRLFLVVVKNNDPLPVLRNIVQLLSTYTRTSVLSTLRH